jgi:hypothetical protein
VRHADPERAQLDALKCNAELRSVVIDIDQTLEEVRADTRALIASSRELRARLVMEREQRHSSEDRAS